MKEYHLQVPIIDEDIKMIRKGDIVYFSGEAWTCRSRLQKAVFDEGWELPFATTERNLLIHVGPVVINKGGEWQLVSFSPTSSIRFEKWGVKSIKDWGLKVIIGKTTMGAATQAAMKEHICIHATPLGVNPNLYADKMKIKEVHWHQELGSIEAAWVFELDNLGPFLVDIDPQGENYYDALDITIELKKREAYSKLGIPEDFAYTKLY